MLGLSPFFHGFKEKATEKEDKSAETKASAAAQAAEVAKAAAEALAEAEARAAAFELRAALDEMGGEDFVNYCAEVGLAAGLLQRCVD